MGSIASLFTSEWSMGSLHLTIVAAVIFPVAYCVFHLYSFLNEIRKIGKEVDKLPGEPKHWLYGNLKQNPGPNQNGLFWYSEIANKYKTATYFWSGALKPAVMCLHPDTAKVILRSSEPKSSSGAYKFILPWLGYGLVTSNGQQWARNRRLLTPAFHFDVLKPYARVYNEAADTLIKKWKESLKTSESVDTFSSLSLCTLNILLRCAFSSDEDVQNTRKQHPYVTGVKTLVRLIARRRFQILQGFDFLYFNKKEGRDFMKACDYAHSVADEVIAKRKESLMAHNKKKTKGHVDFLDILLLARDENGAGLTDLEIRQEVDTFLFAGHDTTASAISWLLYALASNPECQNKARMEIEEVLGDRDKSFIKWEDVVDLPYLTQCIKESLRLVPPVPLISRMNTKPLTIDGVTLHPGTHITINIWAIQHNEHVWGPDVMEYKPERFEAEKMKDKDPFAFVSFSAGPRNCIGQQFAMHEIKIVTAKILLAFNIERDSHHIPEMVPETVIRPRNGIMLRLTPR